MLSNFYDIPAANIYHGAADALSGVDHDIVVLRHVKRIQRFDFLAYPIQNPLIDGVRHAVIDQFGQHQAVLALVKHLKGIRWKRESTADIRIPGQHGIDVPGKLGPLILVDSVRHVRRRPLHLYPA